jgi:hypothetical protein
LRTLAFVLVVKGPRIVELASGVDALYLSGRGIVGTELLERLADDKELAAGVGQQVRFELGGAEWQLQQRGWGMYRFLLVHPFGQIGVSPNHSIPEVRVQPRAEFIHGAGPLEAVAWFRDIFRAEGSNLSWTVSRLDIHTDVQGWQPVGDDRHRFISRSRERVTHEVGGEFTGFEFGRRKTKTVLARIYDKTAEIEHSGAGYWRDIWGDQVDDSIPVIRVEFELGRTFLKQAGVSTPESALNGIANLWKYCTTDWLTLRLPTSDETKRWPIDETWRSIQTAGLGTGGFGVDRMYQGRATGELEKLMPGVIGYLSSVGAVMDKISIGEVCDWMPLLALAYEDRTGTRFEDRVIEKRLELGLPA